MIVSVFTDASWCHESRRAGWGAWIKSNRGYWRGGGAVREKIANSHSSELAALTNGILVSIRRGLAERGDRIIAQTDCSSVSHMFGDNPIRKARYTPFEAVAMSKIEQTLDDYGVALEVRWVKGHSHGDARSHVNNVADYEAMVGLKKARIEEGWSEYLAAPYRLRELEGFR